MAENGGGSPHPAHPAPDAACVAWTACAPRSAEMRAVPAGTRRHARSLAGVGLTPRAEMGEVAARTLGRQSGKMYSTIERGRQVRCRRHG
jgi:hypothetical protein